MTLKEAIEVLKKFKEWANTPTHGSSKYDLIKLFGAIDTVVAEVEKPLPNDEELKELGFLTYRVMLRQLNCKHEKNNVTMSLKELQHWFETGQHLKEWKEIDTI